MRDLDLLNNDVLSLKKNENKRQSADVTDAKVQSAWEIAIFLIAVWFAQSHAKGAGNSKDAVVWTMESLHVPKSIDTSRDVEWREEFGKFFFLFLFRSFPFPDSKEGSVECECALLNGYFYSSKSIV